MKQKFLLLICFMVTLSINAQDIIVKWSGERQNAKLLEVNETEVKYKKTTNLEGPTYSMSVSEIEKIIYQNGEEDVFKIYSTNHLIGYKNYDLITKFQSGVACVYKDNKTGFINSKGEEIIPCIYDNNCFFCDLSDDLIVLRKDLKYGFADKTGKIVIPVIYDYATKFSEGLACVEKNGKWGYIDKSGKTILPFIYYFANDFSEGLAYVAKGDENDWDAYFIDKSGNRAVTIPVVHYPLGGGVSSDFNNGLAAFTTPYIDETVYYFIDKTGKRVITVDGFITTEFSNGLAQISNENGHAYIDTKGNIVIQSPTGFSMGEFVEGFAQIYAEETRYVSRLAPAKTGFIDITGKVVIPVIYYDAENFSEGLSAVKMEKERYVYECGFIDTTGKKVIPLIYENAKSFSEGLAPVCKNKKWGFINKEGKIVIPFIYDEADCFSDGLAPIRIDGYRFWIDKEGKCAINCPN